MERGLGRARGFAQGAQVVLGRIRRQADLAVVVGHGHRVPGAVATPGSGRGPIQLDAGRFTGAAVALEHCRCGAEGSEVLPGTTDGVQYNHESHGQSSFLLRLYHRAQVGEKGKVV